ncbi:ImmA/IrrE family metallo-endopeptidase [Arthrobacter sp. ISL-95]|uniref:ImmA/IrrE family metallo-endopeptidase n=1 Tax=Arthrobacter sp. ISL-95 TaxID=2819116 RepID=UPI001BE6CE5F|nr:ImmA/IrrE family metallo-endopeptidase [Arthrobacter sp. ISL-95]MBT2587990.1 ImmA/IrrE family metallo-endopeptidase [Arthrobacter sp. ISL-95]
MGVKVEFIENLPEQGLYYHDERRAEIRLGMPPDKERSVLAHEAAHAELGHVWTDIWCVNAKMERTANAMAGRRLIDYHEMIRLQRAGLDEKAIGERLGVARVILRAYLWLSSPAWQLAA